VCDCGLLHDQMKYLHLGLLECGISGSSINNIRMVCCSALALDPPSDPDGFLALDQMNYVSQMLIGSSCSWWLGAYLFQQLAQGGTGIWLYHRAMPTALQVFLVVGDS
jgi:hypothetical protein